MRLWEGDSHTAPVGTPLLPEQRPNLSVPRGPRLLSLRAPTALEVGRHGGLAASGRTGGERGRMEAVEQRLGRCHLELQVPGSDVTGVFHR